MISTTTAMAPIPVKPLNGQGVLRISRFPSVKDNSLLSAKSEISIGNWNVRTLRQDGKLEEMVAEFQRYKLDMCALTETRLTGADKTNLEDGMSLLTSGRRDGLHHQGVGLLLGSKASEALTEWEPIDEIQTR